MTGDKPCALDTNIIIDLFRGNKSIADKIDKLEKVFIPFPVLGELYLGAKNSLREAYQLTKITKLLDISEVIHSSNRTTYIYGRYKVYLKRLGKPIPENDIRIAALATENALPLVTRDRHFENLPELEIRKW